jgi:uncharacterized damage-inducible protein DinB
MNFTLPRSLEIIQRTPDILIAMLQNLSDDWTKNTEGGETWSAYDVVGHMVHGERTDWIDRLEIILSDKPDKTFKTFNRFAQFEESKGKSLNQLLDEFKSLRKRNIEILLSKKISVIDEERIGIHPSFGEVKLSNLLSTWAAHDLNHIAQICRVMAKQYKEAVGPWYEYLRIMKS